jgi:methylated-DNA-[protein]-cysteine S-methyltransferase
MYYAVFDTAAGWVAIMGSAKGLRRATLPQRAERAAYELLRVDLKNAAALPRRFGDLIDRYRAYFSGHQVDFPDELDLNGATPFQRDVWQAVRQIPYGQTRGYAWVATEVGRPEAVRAVGQALARNPLPIIVPCHRVLGSDGGLGGFSGGLKMKRSLLKLEASPKG